MEFFIFILWFVFCLFVGSAAGKRKRSAVGWFFLSVLISPILAGLCVLLAGENVEEEKDKL